MPNQEEIEAVREKAEAIIERAGSDPAFAKALQTNPEEALKEAGVPEWALEGRGQEQEGPEVEGYVACIPISGTVIVRCPVGGRTYVVCKPTTCSKTEVIVWNA